MNNETYKSIIRHAHIHILVDKRNIGTHINEIVLRLCIQVRKICIDTQITGNYDNYTQMIKDIHRSFKNYGIDAYG